MKSDLTSTTGVLLLLTGTAFADELILRTGEHVRGTFYGGTAQIIRFVPANDPNRIKDYPETSVKSLSFEPGETRPASTPASQPEHRQPMQFAPVQPTYSGSALSPEPQPLPYHQVAGNPQQPKLLRRGTAITVMTIDAIDSREKESRLYRASLEVPLVGPDGHVLAPHGADVQLILLEDQNSGQFAGRTQLVLSVRSISMDGQPQYVNTSNIVRITGSRGVQSAQRIGLGAGGGAAIGGLAGGGRGAGIGALAGAGLGTLSQIATKGERIKIPAESRLQFTLASDLTLPSQDEPQ